MWKSVLGTSCVLAGSFIVTHQYRVANAEEPGVDHQKPSLHNSIEKANVIAQTFKEKVGSPGLSVGVVHRGKTIWQKAYGFSDVENGIPMSVNSVIRIASISKPIAALLAMRLIEDNKLDVDAKLRDLVPEFPQKFVDGVEADIRVRHVLSHTSGIRHYSKKASKKDNEKENHREFGKAEYYIKDHYDSVIDSLSIFKGDDLLHLPGNGFTYTSHGYTLVAAVIERSTNVKFETQLKQMLNQMNMLDTHLEENDVIIPHRSRHYSREKDGRLKNVPYVDNSYKWAGGGLVSNIPDLLKFAKHIMDIASSQGPAECHYVSRTTLEKAWTPVPNTKLHWFGKDSGLVCRYGYGWGIVETKKKQRFVSHTGGAIGATTVLLMVPEHELGVVILTNVQDASGIGMVGKKIADAFLESIQD